jgi:hypothetical protein
VWLNGGPAVAALPDGSYFFAVLDPSGQANPNDGSAALLSSDPYANRTFSVSGGVIDYSGPDATHSFDSNKIRLMPYNDTSNPGGVYILAICSAPQPVAPSSCKYDAFKISSGTQTLDGLLSATKDVTPSFTRTYGWTIGKDVDKTYVTQAGGTNATFHYTVTVTRAVKTDDTFALTGTIYVVNDPSAGTAHGVSVTDNPTFDQVGPTANCSVSGPVNADIAPGVEIDYPYSCSLTGANASTSGVNGAVINWTNDDSSAGSTAAVPAAFDFSTASPALVDDCVTVTDTVGGTLNGGNPVCASGDLTYDNTVTVPSGTCLTVDNTATFTTDTTGTAISASKSVKACGGADLQVSKTAVPSFTRQYLWSIAKSVDKTRVEQIGGSATFNYTVKVNQTGVLDSNVQAAGVITVTNPNDWESITTDVTDAVDNGGVCTVVNGTGVVIAAGASVQLAYTCTYGSVPGNGTNTATATWDKAAASTADGSANGTASVQFGGPTTTVNKTIHVTDSYAGALGTVTGNDTTPYATATFNYSRTISVPATGCLSYDNTATITETGQNSKVTVQVCGPAKTGALTMGFWQNKNGQGIITGGSSTAGVCNSATWLRQYAPFQDLSSTANCRAVATYVTNIIKAANASGAAMNAMLKAQMLSTALDVYFSDGSLGGNKISAPGPIGSVAIDLTKICAMVDGSSGSGTCGGSYTNTATDGLHAWNDATSLTVSQLLAYAASKSTVGGSTWYAQNKAVQQDAKNTFDAINNQIAFGA